MRHTSRLRRVTGALIATSLAAGLLAAPAAAGTPSTVYVAPVPTAQTPRGTCDSPHHVSIQDAVDAVAPGSTILVCPGTYRETVSVTTPGLTIKGTEPWKAVLKAPATVSAGTRPTGELIVLKIDGADGVTVQWLKLVAPTRAPCLFVDAMIVATNDADDTVIRADRVRPGGRDTLGGSCGYGTGIRIDDGSSALVTHNLVQDFGVYGILAADSGTSADIHRNSVRFRHATESTAATGSGIIVFKGPLARVRANAVVGLETAGSTTPLLHFGIYTIEPAPGLLVRRNLVRYANSGIALFVTSGARVRENTAIDNATWDCYDANAAANVWIGNTGVTDKQGGLCTPPAP